MERRFPPAHRQAASARLRLPERATAIALLFLLHATLFFLIQREFGRHTEKPLLNETWLTFEAPKPRETMPTPIHPVFVAPRASAIMPPFIPPLVSPPPLRSPAVAPNVGGVGRALFNCDIANSQNLPPEQRANCPRSGGAPGSATVEAGLPKTSRAKHAALWAAQLAARRKPPEVPCTHLEKQVRGGPGIQKPVTSLMADPLCFLNGWLNGFHDEPK